MKCIICDHPEIDQCHIRTKGATGINEEWNLFPACRFHHQEQHRIGLVSFYKKHRRFRNLLTQKGWTLKILVGKETLIHNKKEK